ncbi:MAG TPA: hypothetical protein VMZ53_29430 [Kofleriaceae bacterium]|nr:hypothetical protein [Kofleriaceae bacterium]
MRTFLLACLVTSGCLVVASGCVVGDGGEPGSGDDQTEGGSTGGTGSGTGSGTGMGTGTGTGMGTGSGSGSGTSAATCTNAVYDPCTNASQCTSGKCQLFNQQGIQVCTQTCTPGDNTTCPTQNGQAATCNNMGICKPPAANSCTR